MELIRNLQQLRSAMSHISNHLLFNYYESRFVANETIKINAFIREALSKIRSFNKKKRR